MPAGQNVVREQHDVFVGQRLAPERVGRNGLRAREIDVRRQRQLVAHGLDPAARNVPQRTAEVGPARVFGEVEPEIAGGRGPRDRPALQCEVGEKPARREREANHGIDAKPPENGNLALHDPLCDAPRHEEPSWSRDYEWFDRARAGRVKSSD